MNSQDANRITLETYSDKLQKYIDSTPEKINDAEYPWIDQALELVPQGGSILEIGSGAGRNAGYIANKGYDLECTEAVPEFVDIMTQSGLAARQLNILTDPIERQYDMVFANGVLVHFTPAQTKQVFTKIRDALNPHGVFAFSVKMGEGEKWTAEKLDAPRYFYYWQPNELRDLTEKSGFEWLAMDTAETSLKNASWLYIILRRKEV